MNGLPLNIDWQQILLHLLNFVLLSGGLYFLLYRPIQSFLAQREQRYTEREAESVRLRTEAEAMRDEYADKLRRADAEIAARREQIERAAEQEAQLQLQQAQAQVKLILSRAETVSESRRSETVRDLHREAAALAMEAVKHLVLTDGEQALDRFLDAAESESEDEH
ncbi:MAG: hypothetical protein IKS66_05325 [Oscillospiraceae bacterium]|nr:hypothetical protein [Oscillospiraceae bacterium]